MMPGWTIFLIISCCWGLITCEDCSQSNAVDIIFLLDAPQYDFGVVFNMCLQYIADLVDVFNIGPSATRLSVGVMLDSEIVDLQIEWSSDSKDALKTAILDIQYPQNGGHSIQAALQQVETVIQYSSRLPNATVIVVIMTYARRKITNAAAADSLKDMGVSIYLGAIPDYRRFPSGPNIYQGLYVWDIISEPSYRMNVDDTDSFNRISGPITSAACNIRNECTSSPCIDGTCIETLQSFQCMCVPGYIGTLCEQEIDECVSQPCLNGGSCMDEINAYNCSCVPGYTGSRCQSEIDECASSPCENGGTCNDRMNGFTCDCPLGYYGDYCETGICQPSVADIVFVLDSSVSQTEAQFNKQLEFINQFIDHIVIGEKNLQVGVVTFSFQAKIEIQLGQYKDNVTLKEAVRNIKYRPGATFTDKGLEAAADVFNQAPDKRPYGNIAKRYVYVMTDGMSNDKKATQQKAKELKTNVDKVLSIGIGIQVSHKELLDIASKDSHRDRKYVYSVQNFDALYTILKELVQITCDECTWKTSSDIVFLLDTSSTMTTREFQSGLNALTYVTYKTMNLENEDNVVRIGLVTYGAETKVYRSLNDPASKDVFLADIQRIGLKDGHCSSSKSECDAHGLDNALAFVRGRVFDSSTSPMKSDTREMIIVLTNGRNKDFVMDELDSELGNLRTENRAIYVVALGEDSDIQILQNIAGDPALVFSLHDETDLSFLDALTTEFFSSSCDLSNEFENDP